MLKLDDVSTGYEGIDVVKNLSTTFKQGEMVCLIGPNGSGKTTLLKAIAALKEFKGNITYNKVKIDSLPRKEIGKKMAMISQNTHTYFPFTVFDTVMNGRYVYMDGLFRGPSKNDREVVSNSLKRVGMFDYKERYINTLSGGQMQRVYLAKLLAQEPEIILLDEPTNHLDLKYQIETLEFIKELTINENKISVVVLHDLNLVQRYADQVIMLSEGDEFLIGPTHDVLTNEKLNHFYHLDIKDWMISTLEMWRK
jgi:iron complex transport system ATP-binding protein